MNFIITDFLQALNTSHPSPVQCILYWGLRLIFLIHNSVHFILSYLKFLNVYVCPSNYLKNICISTSYCCSLFLTFAPSFLFPFCMENSRIGFKLNQVIFFFLFAELIYYSPWFEQNDLLCSGRNLYIILLEYLS